MESRDNKMLLFAAQLILMIGLLFLFTDLAGILFVGEDYSIRVGFRFKVFSFISLFTVIYLLVSNVLKWTSSQLMYVGYPIYVVAMALFGVFSMPNDLLGYMLGLLVVPFVAQVIRCKGKGWLRYYLRTITQFSGGRFFCRRSLLLVSVTLLSVLILVIGLYNLHSVFHFHPNEFFVESLVAPAVKEKPNRDPNLHDRRDPYRNYPRIFNDLNDTQLVAARANGTPRTLTIEEIEVGMYGLKYIETNKLYKVDPLTHSAPYLVPKAKDFLDDLGNAFQDSLYNRGYDRRHQFIVTSVYRTENHIKKLRRSGNVNASQNSCHQYGTTIDITYVRFEKPDEYFANDMKLQQLLYQTVYDMREAGRCYVKYERKQSCLHITVR